MDLARDDTQGVDYVPCFAVGSVIWSFLVAFLQHGFGLADAAAASKQAILPGVACGVIYGAGIVLAVLAIVSLDYSVASTINQCSLLVTSAWGILLYDEFESDTTKLALFLSGSLVIVAGAAVVSYYGTTE